MKGKQQDYRVEKYIRYGIRKYSFGAASVAVAAGLMFLGNGAVSATEVQGAEAAVAATTAQANPADSNKNKDAVKPETKVEEAKKVNKDILEASIATLESKLATAKYADATVVNSAKEVLATAKATLAKTDASQAEVNAQAETVSELSKVVTESNSAGFDKKQATEKEVAKVEAEKKATPAEKTLSEAKSALEKVSSEADVTNRLAKSELSKKEVKEENKAAVEAAVAKNQAVVTESKALLADKSVTKEQVDAQLERLNESILAVYNELKNAGIGRNGKFSVNLAETETTALIDGSNELGKKWLADHGYASLADVPVKKDSKEIATLNDQIQWLDFSDTTAWTNLVDGKILQVGSQYRKEIMPGYVVTLTVKELKPFESTLAYKNRVAGTEHEASYDADKDNKFNQAVGFSGYPQDGRYTNVRERGAGINTGNAKTALGAVTASGGRVNGVNAGVLFTVDATYKNKPVKPGIVMTSGEDISDANYEAEIYTTNGTPWELAGTVGSGNKTQYNPLPNFNRVNGTLTFNTEEFKKALAAKMFATRDSVTAGLGSQIFGSYTNGGGKYSTPIVSTANPSEVGIYIISTGLQSTMIGVKISDFGDLPESYGVAEHFVRTESKDWNTNVVRQIQQPYLGTEKADVDSVSGIRVRGEGSDDRKDSADEGVKQLLASEHVHNNIDTGEPEVKLVKAQDNTYEVNIIASANGNTNYTGALEPAYVRGFIDFNNNGKFDADEASDIVKVTENNQKVTLRFTHKQIVDTTKETVNFRVRIAKAESQVEKPVGIAYSGEVEDNQIQVALPPRGDKEETTGLQGETQSVAFEFVNRAEGDDATNVGSGNGKTTFNSYGKVYYSEQRNTISLETTKVKQADGVMIVKPDGTLAKTYTKDGQGTYEVTDTGVTFTPVANFVGKADGIVLRAVDANGQSTGWTAAADTGLENNNTGIHTTTEKTMDAVYIPTVTPKLITGEPKTSIDVQGKEQKETVVFKTDAGKATEAVVTPTATHPAKLIDPTTKAPIDATSVTVENEGIYTINPTTGEVKFQPLPTFKGKTKGIGVSLTVPIGTNQAGTEVTATATTTYTPEVVPVVPTAEPATTTDIQGAEQSAVVAFAPGKATIGDAEKTVELKPNSAKLLNADGSVPTEATVPAFAEDGVTRVGTYSIDPATNRVTFTPTDKAYVGKVLPANVQAEDVNGTTVKTTYTPTIVGVKPTATPGESTNIQGEVQSGTVAFAPGKATIGDVEKTVAIKPNSAKLLNADGSVPTEATVPAYKEDGVTQVGTYSIDPATNTVTFTPTDKTYTGKVLPANVQAEDENGSTVKTTYTPHIVGVTPTADPATSTDIQGVEQSKEVTFTPGKTEINGTEKTVAIDTTSFKLLDENESAVDSVPAKNPAGDVIGTYTLKVVDGKVNAVFTPTDKTYAGEVEPVTIQAKDTNGTVVKTTYTPSITPVEPSGTPTTSEGIQGAKQEGTPSFTPGDERIPMKIDADQPAKLVNPETGKPTDDTTIPAKDNDGNTVGTYTIEPTTGKVTFTPNKDFTGTPVAATVQAKDANGTPTTATYEPTVKPVTPTGSDTVTEDVQGSIQKGKPTFEGGKVTVNGEEKTVAIDEDKPAKLVDPKTGDPVESVTIDGEGTYTVTPDGTVTFTPEKNFTGKGTGVTVQREDKNATPVTAKYTPVVKPATPTSSDVITTNVQGAIQEGTPTFTGGKVTINGQEKTVAIDEAVKPKFDDGTTEKVVPNEGTYTIDENGKVTFTPEKTFTGQAAGVTVKRVDKNGTPVTAKYTPVVIPVSPTSKDAESEGPKGQSQEGTPTFTGGKVTLNGKEVPVAIDENVKPKFDDGTTEKVVPNEGTYTIDENGKVTFTPEPEFVGKGTGVTVKRVDKNGTPITATYTPTVRPVTSFKDKEGNAIPNYPTEDGTTPKKDIPGYRFVETKKLPNGDTEHVYEKVKTSHKDKEGNVIPNYPTEDGEQPKKDIPGYRFVETKKLPNGDTEHVYEKVKTSHKDKEGNVIPNYPTEDGEQPKK
ncbi:GEVED domain-containing protein, partial [Streptococcus mitis]|uniref:GEVED domain-containing protein n=1 Tax=Streptococcus mitis TaxID=28037 RepID=UPI0021B60D9D